MCNKDIRVAILGTENSHALAFGQLINGGHPLRGGRPTPGFRVTSAYGYDGAANDKLRELCGVEYFADSPEQLIDHCDAIMVTARHGANHLPYARELIKAGKPAFIDKPTTCDEGEAVELVRLAKAAGVPLCSFSCCGYVTDTIALKQMVARERDKLIGGSVSSPVSLENEYGGFWFYTQHLIQIMGEIFGYDVKTVRAKKRSDSVIMQANYGDFEVSGHWGPSDYSASVYFKNRSVLRSLDIGTDGYQRELNLFTDMVLSGQPPVDYRDMIAPVFILTAVERAFESGEEVAVNEIPEL